MQTCGVSTSTVPIKPTSYKSVHILYQIVLDITKDYSIACASILGRAEIQSPVSSYRQIGLFPTGPLISKTAEDELGQLQGEVGEEGQVPHQVR